MNAIKTMCALVVLAGASPAMAANILVNAGFETGTLSPWTTPSGSAFVTNTEAHTGTFSVAALGGDSIRQNFAAVATSSVNQVSIWVKRAGGPFDSYSFHYDDGSSQNFLISSIGAGNDWLFFNLTANLAAGKNLNGFSIFGTSPGPAYLDDVVIDVGRLAVPEPSTWAMLTLGFGLLGGAMRRRSKAALRFA